MYRCLENRPIAHSRYPYLKNDNADPIINFIRREDLYNKPDDPVKVLTIPTLSLPPAPCLAWIIRNLCAVATVLSEVMTANSAAYALRSIGKRGAGRYESDLAGFGDFVLKNIENYVNKGIYVVQRFDKRFDDSATVLAFNTFTFVQKLCRERIAQRNQSENVAAEFDWSSLYRFYEKAYQWAMYKK